MRKKPLQYDGMGGAIGPGAPGGARGQLSRLLNAKTFDSLKNSTFRIFWAASLCQMAAMNMQMMARSLLIYRLTDSPLILAIMTLFNALPMLLLSLYGGVLADRLPKKQVMIVGQVGSAVVSVGIALALQTGFLSETREGSWWILAGAALFQGIIMGLMMPARQAMIPEIVGEERLLNAISLNNLGMSTMRMIAPAAAGFIIGESYNFQAVYFTMTVMYVIGVGLLTFLPKTSTTPSRGRSALADIKEGLSYLRGQTVVLFTLAFTLFAVLLSMPYALLLPVFTEDILDVGSVGLGILMTVSGAGSIVSSLALASLPNKKRGLMLLIGTLIMALALIGFAFSTSMAVSLGFIIFVGMGQASRMALGNTLIQYYVDAEYRGRVMSIYMMQFGLTSLSTVAAGIMAETLNIQWVIGGFAMALTTVTLCAMAFAKRLRQLD